MGEGVITHNTGKLSQNNIELLNFSERIQFAVPTARLPGRFSLFLWPRITLYYTFPPTKEALVLSCPEVLHNVIGSVLRSWGCCEFLPCGSPVHKSKYIC